MARSCPDFQLERMWQAMQSGQSQENDKVIRESFQKLQEWLCGNGFRDGVLEVINTNIIFADAAPPGLRFTKADKLSPGGHLKVSDVPSNRNGAPIHVTGDIIAVVCGSLRGIPKTYNLTIQEDKAGVLIDIATVNVIGTDRAVFKTSNGTLPNGLSVTEANKMAVYGSGYAFGSEPSDVICDVIVGQPS